MFFFFYTLCAGASVWASSSFDFLLLWSLEIRFFWSATLQVHTSKTSAPLFVSNLNQNTALTCFHCFTCCCSFVQTCPCHVFIYLFAFILHLWRMPVFNRTHQIYLFFFFFVYVHQQIEPFGCIKNCSRDSFVKVAVYWTDLHIKRINKITQNTKHFQVQLYESTFWVWLVLVGRTVSPNPQTTHFYEVYTERSAGTNDRLKDKVVTGNTLQGVCVGRNVWSFPSEGELVTVQTWTLEY